MMPYSNAHRLIHFPSLNAKCTPHCSSMHTSGPDLRRLTLTEQRGIEPLVRPPGPALGGGGTPTPLCTKGLALPAEDMQSAEMAWQGTLPFDGYLWAWGMFTVRLGLTCFTAG
jgi:hypothetical protein